VGFVEQPQAAILSRLPALDQCTYRQHAAFASTRLNAPLQMDANLRSNHNIRLTMIPIYESYEGYRPPHYVYPTIAKLLVCVPSQYLSGVRSVVLTNASAIGRGKTRRVAGKKYARRDCFGFYHPKTNGEQPWIEIVVDNILARWFNRGVSRFLTAIPFVRDTAFAQVLYHEVGHHVERIIGAPAPAGEAAAEAWKERLCGIYFRKRYWYLRPLARLVKVATALKGRLEAR
jgi:hypothetical protein